MKPVEIEFLIKNGTKATLDKISADVTKVGTNAIDANNAIVDSISNVGKTLAAGYGIQQLASQLYTFSNSYNRSLREVSTISQEVSGDIEAYKQTILNMTGEIPVAADEAAKALYQIVSAGYDGAEGMNVLEVSAKAAIGGVTETVTSADAITTLLNAYKLSADDAENVSDMLFTTVKLGKTTMGELGQDIAQVAPIAASFGIEMEQVLGAVATLTKSGVPTAQAMTQIRGGVIAATKVLGDGYFATHTLQQGLVEIMEMSGGSEAKLRELVPEVEGLNAVLGLTGINAESAASDLELMTDAAGATQVAYEKMLEGPDQQLILLKNNALAYFSALGDGALDSVGSIATYLNEAFQSGDIEKFGDVVMVLVSAFGIYKGSVIATNVVMKVQKALLTEAIIQKKLAAAAGITLSNAEAMAAARTTLLSAAQFKLVTSLKAVKAAMMSNPWTAALVGITAVVTAIVLLKDRTNEVSDAMKDATREADAEQTKLKALENVLKDSNKPYADRKRALDELKSAMPSYNATLSEEGVLIDDNTASLKLYIEQLKNSARAKVATDQMLRAEQNRSDWYNVIGSAGIKALGKGDQREQYVSMFGEEQASKLVPYDSDINLYDKLKNQRSQFDAEVEKWSDIVDKYTAMSVELVNNDQVVDVSGTGTSTGDNSEKQYQNARLASIKEAADAELEIDRSKITDKIKLIEFERDAQIEAIKAEKQAYQDKYGDDADVSGFDRQIKATSDQADVDIAAINDKASKGEADKRAKINEETLQKFATFKERYEALLQEHEANKEAIQEAGGSADNEAVAKEQYEAKVAALNNEVLGTIDDFKLLADGVVDAEIDEMLKVLAKAKSEMQGAGADDVKVAAINAEIARLIALKKKNEATSNSRTLKEWQDMESQLKSCTSSLREMGDEIGGVAGEAISAAGDIAGSMTSMVSGIVMLVENGVSGMTAAGKAGSTALKTVETASVILAVIGAVISLTTKLYNLIEGNKQESLQKEIDMYNELVSTYDTLIDKQKELLNNSKQATALAAYNKALDMVDAKQEAAAASLRKWFSSGANLFSHSEGYKYNEDFGGKLSQKQLFSMDAAQWEDWMTSNAKTWSSLPGEVRKYAQAVMDSGVQTEELTAAWKEFMAGFSIDDARSGLLDMLNDVDATAEDVADNLNKYFTQAINKVVANGLDEDLVQWYDDLADAMEGGLTKTERDALESEYNRIVKEGQDQRDAAFELSGYKPEDTPSPQSGKPGSFEAMTQDQGTKLEGLFTANEMRSARIEDKVETVASQMDTAVGHLARIETNTENSARSLKSLDEKIDRIIRDGVKIS